MALLTSEFMRAHPVKSGMVWTGMFAPASLLGSWLFNSPPFNKTYLIVFLPMTILGGLAWGYAMKAYHDRMAGRS